MLNRWQLQDAKNRFSELVEAARARGPQVVTRRGADTAVVLSTEDYRRLVAQKGNLVEFFQRSPLVGVELDLERRIDVSRDVAL